MLDDIVQMNEFPVVQKRSNWTWKHYRPWTEKNKNKKKLNNKLT